MDLNDARILAELHMEKHLDDSWTFRFNNRKRAYGLCNHRSKTIELSRLMTAGETEEATEQTILHEIAHALTPGAGHGREWKLVARGLGVRAPKSRRKSTAKNTDHMPTPTWVILLDGVEAVCEYYRKPTYKVRSSIHRRGIKGRPDTIGRLSIVPYADYLKVKGN